MIHILQESKRAFLLTRESLAEALLQTHRNFDNLTLILNLFRQFLTFKDL